MLLLSLSSLHASIWSNTRHACLNLDSGSYVFNLRFAVTRASARSRSASTMTWSFKSAKISWRKALFCCFESSSTCSLVLTEYYLHPDANPGNSRVMRSSRWISLAPDSIAVSLVSLFSTYYLITKKMFPLIQNIDITIVCIKRYLNNYGRRATICSSDKV